MQNNLFIVCCEKQCLNNLQRKVTWANSNEPIFNIGDFWEFSPHTTDFDLCKLWKLRNTVQAYVVLHPGPYNNCWWPTWPHNKNPGFSVRRTWNRFFNQTFLRKCKKSPEHDKAHKKEHDFIFQKCQCMRNKKFAGRYTLLYLDPKFHQTKFHSLFGL